jgi:two-component system sensor histidine kinase EvgS
MSGSNFDQTNLQNIEEELISQKAILENILEGTNAGTWYWNVQTGEVTLNERWADIIGYTLDELIPTSIKTWEDYTHPDDLVKANEALEKHFSRRLEYYDVDFRQKHKNGDWVWVNARGKVVEWTNDDKPLWMFGTHLDITERKRAEEDRGKLQAQLIQAQKMESVGTLAGGVAHDFNNMLAVILGNVEMALKQVDPAQPLHANLQEIHEAAERSADLTRQLLAFARRQTIAPKVLDLNETVAGTLKMLQRLISEDIDLAWSPGANLWSVKMDPSQIDQILANLCVNARDAITGAGKITIETGNSSFDEEDCVDSATGIILGEFIQLTVSDDGCGMDKTTCDMIFEPFFTTKGASRGTGLGLSTVYGIVKQNNGFINVYSEPGEGTTFRLYLPRYVGEAEKNSAEGPAEVPVGHGERVLLVEDEPAVMKMSKKMLRRLGYQVLAASTPREALRLATEYSGGIHLVITDVVLPEMNGRDLSDQLCSLYPGIKTLFMSGYTANVIAHQGVLDDGVNFLQKPFSMKDLGVKVRGILG